jgi:LL-diaminopimelate aminotransferase
MEFMDDRIAERLGGLNFGKSTTIYKFELIKRAKAAARIAHPDMSLIDMGVGEPDWAADESVVQTLRTEAGLPTNRWYSDNGILEFQEAAVEYMSRVYGVTGLKAPENVVHGIGSKPILAMLPICFINPGDIVLSTVPGYPVTGTYTQYLGGEVYDLPLKEENAYLPDLESIPASVLAKAKMLYMCYPNNPTGAVASPQFFSKVVAFAKKNSIVVIHDAAYSALTYDGYKPLSILSVDGAIDVALEVHSLSKSFNMTGWRIGFVVGNSKAVAAYATVKDNTDSGQFRAIQKAGITALKSPQITEKTVAKYSRRFDLLVNALNKVGFNATKPKGSFYIYVKTPSKAGDGTVFNTATEFAEFLIKEAMISTVPWDDVGHYLRFSVTFEAENEEKEIDVVNDMMERMDKLNLQF